MKQILEGSRAIALTIKNIKPAVISAYPITPQTHIVEDLAKFKSLGEANYEYVLAESEFAAASIVLGASATGVRTYTATSSQGLLLMTEVIYNIAGMRLPIVLTCANRAVSAPINIWNDQQDVMTVRDSGWIMFFSENNQEAVDQHILAYKISEKIKIPVMVNVDGFVMTHTYESVEIPDEKLINKFLPPFKPAKGEFLDTQNPVSLGSLAFPSHYMEIREELQDDLIKSFDLIKKEYNNYKKIIKIENKDQNTIIDNAFFEYYGPKNPKIIIIAMGSVIGTIKDTIDEYNKKFILSGKVGVLKIKLFRPFPHEEVINILKKTKYIAVIDKSISLGSIGPLALEIKSAAQGIIKNKIKSFILGLGGRDITKKMIKKVIEEVKNNNGDVRFIGRA